MLLAYHNDPAVKDKYIARVKEHQKADEFIKGIYWENGKGCAVGCTIHGSNHQAYEDELGIPKVLAHLEDYIFENLPNNLAKKWPLKFLESIKTGSDLSNVWPKFAIWLLNDEKYGVLQYIKDAEVALTVKKIIKAYNNYNQNDKDKWHKLYLDAQRHAAATVTTAYAAAIAAYAAIDISIKEKHVIAQSEKLLELLRMAD